MSVQAEVAEKLRRIRGLLREQKLSGIYLKKHANFAWITGGQTNVINITSDLGAVGILVTESNVFAVSNSIEAPRLEREAQLPALGFELRPFPWWEDREVKSVRELGGGALGADFGFPEASDVSGAVNALRYELTPWEVERYREQGRLSAQILEEVVAGIRPGETESAVVGRLAERLWAHRMDFAIAFCAADDRIRLFRHPISTGAKVERRAMVSVNTRRGGLIVSLTRFVQFGRVPEELARKYRDNVSIDCTMMAATIPGRPALEAFEAGLAQYRALGYPEEYKLHHQGGSIGYQPRDYRVTFGMTEIVRENQGFAWNPSITGVKSEDTMLATSAGPELLSEPVTFPVLTVEAGGRTFRRPAILEL